jgi:hypothetical protein
MATRNEWLLFAIAFAFFTNAVVGQGQQPQTGAGVVSVNDLVGKPTDHLGQIQLVGVVAAVSQGKGFVLVDKREYADCGLSCVAEPGTKKLPVRWSGDAPKLEQTVWIEGTLTQTDKGLSFVAQEVRVP